MHENLVFLLAFTASAAAPGPEIALLVSRALAGGLRNSLPLLVGITLGKLLMLTAALLGLTALVQFAGPVLVVLKWLGIGYLLYLGVRKVLLAANPLHFQEDPRPLGFMAELGTGTTLTLSNPMALVFYISLLPGVVGQTGVGLGQGMMLAGLLALAMLSIGLVYGGLAEVARKSLTSGQAKSNLHRTAGLMMVGAALLMGLRS